MFRRTWCAPAWPRTGANSSRFPICATGSLKPPSSSRWRVISVGCSGLPPLRGRFQRMPATIPGDLPSLRASARQSSERFGMRAQLERDFERFKRELPRDFPEYIRDTYRIDLASRYLGYRLPHPIGKGSGQLSLSQEQLDTDRAAGLAFVVLKTVIAEDATGTRSMEAWAVHETRMKVERRASLTGQEGWTVTWKGRGWDRPFEEY